MHGLHENSSRSFAESPMKPQRHHQQQVEMEIECKASEPTRASAVVKAPVVQGLQGYLYRQMPERKKSPWQKVISTRLHKHLVGFAFVLANGVAYPLHTRSSGANWRTAS